MGAVNLDHLRAQVEMEKHAEMQLRAALQATMQNPGRQVRINGAMILFGRDERGQGSLFVAQPNGERIDVPVPKEICPELIKGLQNLMTLDAESSPAA